MSATLVVTTIPSTPAPPVGKAVLDDDVLRLVFELFIPPLFETESSPTTEFSRNGRTELRRFALVCKAFSAPALDCLWANLPSLEPLLRLHPSMQKFNGLYFFGLKPVDGGKISAFEGICQRVKSVRLTTTSLPAISPAGYTWLGRHAADGGKPLLPALRQIDVALGAYNDGSEIGILSLLLSPTVERIAFSGDSVVLGDLFQACTLPLVGSKATGLRHLSLQDTSSNSTAGVAVWNSLLQTIGSLNLRSLDLRFPSLCTLPSTFIARLSDRMPTLTSLTLDVHAPSHSQPNLDTSASPPEPTPLLFPSLRSINIVNRATNKLCNCIPAALINRATSLTFYLTQSLESPDPLRPVLDTLSNVWSLKTVTLAGATNTDVAVRPSVATEFLRRLKTLEEFHMKALSFQESTAGASGRQPGQEIWDALDAVTVRDSGVHRNGKSKKPLSRKSPRLRSLTLPLERRMEDTDRYYRSYHDRPSPAHPPLDSLLRVASAPASLQDITLSINSSSFGSHESLSSLLASWQAPSRASNLRHLSIADKRRLPDNSSSVGIPASACRDIARFLDNIFPNLASLTYCYPDSPLAASWEVIEYFRRMHKTLRLYQTKHL